MSLAAYTQNILGLIDRNTEFKDYDNIIGNLNETDCYFLSRELRGLIRSIKPSLEKVEDNNYHRNWTRARDYIMESVDNKVNECNQTLNSKSEKTSIDNYRNKLDSFLKDVNGFESKSDYELEVRIKELEDIYKNENSDMYKKSRFHERAELARTELSRRAESRRIEESKTRSNFTTLFNLGNYLMSKFK